MPVSSETIDRIVANVLSQLGAPVAAPLQKPVGDSQGVVVDAAVVTAELLESAPLGAVVTVGAKAIVTPAAWDAAQQRKIQVRRHETGRAKPAAARSKEAAASPPTSTALQPVLIVIRNAGCMDQLWEELSGTWRRELLGCPDDAAKLAQSILCRGEAGTVVILAEQTHRAACLANRNDRVKAVAIGHPAEVRTVKRQLKANVWCVDPTGRSFFEMKKLLSDVVLR